MNSFHCNTKRKKERSKKWQAKWPTSKFKMSMNVSCMWSAESIVKKTEAWASSEVQFVDHTSHLWWDGVCDICKFQPARTGIKGVISALLLLLHSRTEWTSVLTWQVKKDRTGCKPLKGFNKFFFLLILQIGVLVTLQCQVIYHFLTSFWFVLAIVIFEGLQGGLAYVNTFYLMSSEVSNSEPKKDYYWFHFSLVLELHDRQIINTYLLLISFSWTMSTLQSLFLIKNSYQTFTKVIVDIKDKSTWLKINLLFIFYPVN